MSYDSMSYDFMSCELRLHEFPCECISAHFAGIDLDKSPCARRRRTAFWKCAKNVGNPCFFCTGTHSGPQTVSLPANGFQKSFKTMENEAKTTFLGAQTVTVPWPWVGDAPREGVRSNAKSLKTLRKRRVRRLRWRHFHCAHRPPQTVSLPANGFPKSFKDIGK